VSEDIDQVKGERNALEDAVVTLASLLASERMKVPSGDRGCCESAYIEGCRNAYWKADDYKAALHSILELGIECDDARDGFVDAVTIAAKALGLKAAFS
jgi:hypothetical protein